MARGTVEPVARRRSPSGSFSTTSRPYSGVCGLFRDRGGRFGAPGVAPGARRRQAAIPGFAADEGQYSACADRARGVGAVVARGPVPSSLERRPWHRPGCFAVRSAGAGRVPVGRPRDRSVVVPRSWADAGPPRTPHGGRVRAGGARAGDARSRPSAPSPERVALARGRAGGSLGADRLPVPRRLPARDLRDNRDRAAYRACARCCGARRVLPAARSGPCRIPPRARLGCCDRATDAPRCDRCAARASGSSGEACRDLVSTRERTTE